MNWPLGTNSPMKPWQKWNERDETRRSLASSIRPKFWSRTTRITPSNYFNRYFNKFGFCHPLNSKLKILAVSLHYSNRIDRAKWIRYQFSRANFSSSINRQKKARQNNGDDRKASA